jgi:prepilin-type N-terminal cleavage/methylation domain-containing protein
MSLRDDRGFTLVELLTVISISLVVLSATLAVLAGLSNAAHDNNIRLETTEEARNALDVQAKQLRSLARRLNNTPVLDTVEPYDLIFQTSDPSRTWVRYCLDTVNPPATASQARLWMQSRSLASAVASPVSAAMRTGCPSSSAEWTVTNPVAEHLTNRRSGLNRPLFEFRCTTSPTCTSAAATYDQIVNVAMQTFVDTDPFSGVPELRVATGVYLRNQNQAPVASFVATPASTSRTVVLNASASTDYEGRTLDYYWFKGSVPALGAIDCADPTVTGTGAVRTLWGASGYVGEAITLNLTFTAADAMAGPTARIGLVVCDPGDRYGTAGITSTINVQIPS